ncbi:MAG TPA: rhomboid family intramembrane serine protease [Gemmatimonadales bacterium]
MFPYKDENPTILTPVVTVGLIVATSLVWVLVQGAGSQPALARSVCRWGLVAGELLGRVADGTVVPLGPQLGCRLGSAHWITPISSMFLHGGWFHLIGNMWFLWVFGNNIEDAMGHGRFVAFYIVCGLLAAGAQMMMDPGAAIPMVGASGAISGVMGAYLVLYPRARVHMLIFLGFFVTTAVVPAYLMLLYWAFLQLLGSLPAMGGGASGGGVAFMAHVGGFVAGVVLIRLFAKPELLAAHRRAARVIVGTFEGR